MDEHLKTCDDYAEVGIGRHSDIMGYHVTRQGRHVYSTNSPRDAAMFAEELYERILAIRAAPPNSERGE